ncbi:unnamed protein product [Didymodactylos carnosus]|uniref:RNA-binding protein 42 n=1 Tax=Didymodactylos carnosus TaxID=1234261 RepID=A0A813RDJ5_9BILA|nr:unnamed protein product [Didymodactylos carnosus]CAF3562536.1 unnamed protein product [Didymodactylos carnosus]
MVSFINSYFILPGSHTQAFVSFATANPPPLPPLPPPPPNFVAFSQPIHLPPPLPMPVDTTSNPIRQSVNPSFSNPGSNSGLRGNLFVPHQLRQRVPQQTSAFSIKSASLPVSIPQIQPKAQSPPRSIPLAATASKISSSNTPASTFAAQPLLYSKNSSSVEKPVTPSKPDLVFSRTPSVAVSPVEVQKKLEQLVTLKNEKSSTTSANSKSVTMSQANESFDDMDTESGSGKKKGKKVSKKARYVRMAAGQTWEDESLADWDTDDFRLFCGDLGNEVNDDVLARAFSKYPSFQKAKVIRDKRTGKTRGYGFVSFKDSHDFIKAMREMNGKYVGNRPIKLRKSQWKDRNMDVVKKKVKEKVKMGLR